jgi:signal peptidase I
VRDKRVIGAALSLIMPGAGQLALGHTGRGIFWAVLPTLGAVASLVTGVFGLSMILIARVGSLIDAIVSRPARKGAPGWMPVIAAWVGLFAAQLMLGFVTRALVAETYKMPSGSMMPTLLIGDYVVVNKAAFRLRAPRRGELVVIEYPSQPEKTLVKRVMATAGDTITVRDDLVYVNKSPVGRRQVAASCEGLGASTSCQRFEEVLDGSRYEIMLSGASLQAGMPDDAGACPPNMALVRGAEGAGCVVPPGHVLVMGDNRHNSFDSRSFGPVKVETILARPAMIWMSLDEQGSVRWDRVGMQVR